MKHKTRKKALSWLLSLVMVLGLMPGMSLPAYAWQDNPYAGIVVANNDNATSLASKKAKFNDIDWYIIKDESTATNQGTLTLFLVNDQSITDSEIFAESDDSGNMYSTSKVASYLKRLTDSGSFKSVADAIETIKVKGSDSDNEIDAKLWLLSTSEASALPTAARVASRTWWLRSPGNVYYNPEKHVAAVYRTGEINNAPISNYNAVRPAMKLDLSKVTFSSVALSGGANATTSGGATRQSFFSMGASQSTMASVTYTPQADYKFPETSELYTTQNGITVERNSNTGAVTVSGTLSGVVNVAVPDAVSTHVHSFTYDADGATITATCSNTDEKCFLNDGQGNHTATLTIAAPALNTYGGSESADATITDADSIRGNAAVIYKKGDDTLDAAPTDAGTYTASITLGEDDNAATATVEYTIAKADPTATAPTPSATYGQTLSDVTLTNPGGNTLGSWEWANKTTSVGDVGTHVFKANFTPTDTENYNIKNDVDVTVTVNKADATDEMQAATATLVAKSGQTTIVDYTLPDGANYGTATNSNTEFFTVDASNRLVLTAAKDWTETDWATDAKKTFTVQITGAKNYKDYTLTVTVSPNYKPVQTIEAADVTATYGDTNISVSASVTEPATGAGALSYAVTSGDAVTVDANTGALTIVKAGTATVTVTAAETSDYAATTKDVTVTVSKAEPTATAPTATATYGQTLAAVTLTNPDGNTLGTWAWVAALTTSVGSVGTNTFKANFTPTDTGNYNSVSNVDVTVTVAKATPTATAPTATATYGQTLANVTLTNPDGNTPGTWAWADALTTSVGNVGPHTFKANFTPDDTTNYSAVTNVDVTVTVNKADATVTATPAAKENLTFNGGDQALVNAGTANGGTMQYALGTDSAATGDYSADIPKGKAAQTYYVWYKVVGDANHNDSEAGGPVSVTIGKTSLEAEGITIYAIPDQNYNNGNEIEPQPVVKHLGYLLKENEDYTLSYTNNIQQCEWTDEVPDNAPTVTVTGMGGYIGTLTRTFKIILPAYSGTLTVTDPGERTYGAPLGDAPTVSTTNVSGLSGETVTVYYATTPSGTGTVWNSSARLNAGTYYVWAELAATGTHDTATSPRVPFTVSKATPTAPDGVLAAAGYQNTYKVTLTIPSGKTYADYEYVVSTSDATPADNAWKSLPALKENSFTPPEATEKDTTYHVFLRTKADSNNNASPVAKATLKTPTKVLLRYDANGSTASVPASVEYDSNATATAAAAISRAGYTFAGWNTAASGGTHYEAGAAFTISANTTLYAQWTPNSYTVQYDANGGEGTINDGTFTYGTAAALSDGYGLLRSGCTFRGWATSASGDVVYSKSQKVSTLTTENNGRITLYAVWTQDKYEVSGTVMEELEGTTDKSIVAGVDVKIVRGNVEFATTTTGDNGTYKFTGVPAGTYNIIATRKIDPSTDKTQTMTALVEVKGDATVDTIVLPPSKINSVLTVTGDSTPPVMVGGLEEVAMDEAESTKEVTVTMTVEKKDESTVAGAEEIKEAVAANASTDSGNTVLDFLDVTVTKKVDNDEPTTVTETSQVVEIIVSFNMNGRFGFSLYRHHDGKAEAFQSRSNRFTTKSSFADGYFFADKTAGLFYIYTSRFSTYAIGYAEGEEPAPTPAPTPTPTPTYSGGSSGGGYGALTYAPTVGESANGRVTVSPAAPKAGNKVTVTATPDAGYTVDTVTVTDANGKAVAVTKNADGTYTFTQPSGKVKIDVTYKASGETAPAPAPDRDALAAYTDLDAGAWYAAGIRYALENGVMSGYGDGKFGPSDTTSRAMLAQILYNLEGRPAYSGAADFTDVNGSDWYAAAIAWASGEGLVGGYGDGLFGPEDAITREQLVTILYRYAQFKGLDVSAGEDANLLGYDDAGEVSDWAAAAMQWAVGSGLVNGKTATTLNPQDSAARAEIATIIMRYCENLAK